MNPLVALIVNQPDMVGNLLAMHEDNGRGYCRTCSVGAQRGRYRYPCTIRASAEEAQRIVDKQYDAALGQVASR